MNDPISHPPVAYCGAEIFDGQDSHRDAALLVSGDHVVDITPLDQIAPDIARKQLTGGLIAPGFVDLQVNGGGGVMLNNAPDVGTIRTICDAHLQFGTTSLLPTMITDTPEQTDRVMQAGRDALAQGIAGAIGLHLEGPHLSLARKGAHDPNLIRGMTDADCAAMCRLAQDLPNLLVTLAPESASNRQITTLTEHGAVVSLGHSDADFQTLRSAADSGARCATHLFNAMSQLTNREPGLVGAALETGTLFAGLIADGIHVAPASIRVALRAKAGPGRIFLVTDAMATIGTKLTEFTLNGRSIYRRDGCLTLADGTLAGADLDMISAVRFMVNDIGLPVGAALQMAALHPAHLLGQTDKIGRLGAGTQADFIHLNDNLDIQAVWRLGQKF